MEKSSTMQETFILMSTLLAPNIPRPYLNQCAQVLQKRHMVSIYEERASQNLCGFPCCGNPCSNSSKKVGKYRISLAKKEIYDASEEGMFCSKHCIQQADQFSVRLANKPPQLVPSLFQIFGTDRPNPFASKTSLQSTTQVGDSAQSTESNCTRSTNVPKVKTIWSKTSNLGIVERAPKPQKTIIDPVIQENKSPAPPSAVFPTTTEEAQLIEGFVFPAHKKGLAKRMTKALRVYQGEKTSEQEADKSSSDHDTTDDEDSGMSEDESEVDSDEDEESQVWISIDDLPLFTNLWRLLSEWITPLTSAIIHSDDGQGSINATEMKMSESDLTKQNQNQNQAHHKERLEIFGTLVRRPLANVAKELNLRCDRWVQQQIYKLESTFHFQNPIDGRDPHQWKCIGALLLTVIHKKGIEANLTEEKEFFSKLQVLTKMDHHEILQLLQLLYSKHDETEIIVDLDNVQVVEDVPKIPTNATDHESIEFCRKCRRSKNKCKCTKKSDKAKEVISEQELQTMFHDALTLRQTVEDVMEQYQ